MSDIIVTTPRLASDSAATEARDCIAAGGGNYFRRLPTPGPQIEPGDRVYYVEDGYVRGYAVVAWAGSGGGRKCDTTGREWDSGFYVQMPADSWRWLKPISMPGFQGWRYAPHRWRELEETGGWLDPRPGVEEFAPAAECPPSVSGRPAGASSGVLATNRQAGEDPAILTRPGTVQEQG